MARQETINKYFCRKKRDVKSVEKDADAHSSICREMGSSKGELVGLWLERMSEEDGADRKERVRQLCAATPQEIKDLAVNIHLHLPKAFQKLARIFRVLQTIQRFNAARRLTTIFAKSQGCIEGLVKQRVGVDDIERMHYVAPALFEFKRISVLHNEEETDTFTVQVHGEAVDFDKALFAHVKRHHAMFLEKNGFGDSGRFHPDFDFECVPLPGRPLFPCERQETLAARPEIVEIARKKASSVLERIREKERMRREAFISRAKEEEDCLALERRVQTLFRSENRQAMAVARIAELLKVFGGAETVRRLASRALFCTRVMGDTEYLIFKECSSK